MLVNDLGRKVNAILNDDLLLRQATVDIHRTFGFHNVMIFMLDERRQRLELQGAGRALRRARGEQHEHLARRGHHRPRLPHAGAPRCVEDVSRDKDFVDWFADTKSEIAVPIQIGGVVEGVLNVESDRTNAFGAVGAAGARDRRRTSWRSRSRTRASSAW